MIKAVFNVLSLSLSLWFISHDDLPVLLSISQYKVLLVQSEAYVGDRVAET